MVNIKVAVRIRPFSEREVNQKDESIVQTYEKSVLVTNLKVPEVPNGDSRQRIRRFAVDYCYDPKYPNTCTQESVYQDIGKEVLDSMFNGYNACVLAYGHSASGKTYTMMGDEDDPGLTPRICQGLFRRMHGKSLTTRVRFHTAISFLEIYNERVRDLLVNDVSGATAGSNFSLRVREHPKLGPYVQDLSQHIVDDEEQILEYLATGNSRRSTAATENNIHSSRSHAVFTIKFSQTEELNYQSELSSKVHLVDLAGRLTLMDFYFMMNELIKNICHSLIYATRIAYKIVFNPRLRRNIKCKHFSERAGSTQSRTRLKEGANINKSLVTLGNVISALAESCETFVNPKDQPVAKTWQPFVPYRDSVLTWLLKDTLGGNSNTIMIATVSPASSCLNETINTLRYAKRTKRIVNQPIINEDPKIRTIRELKEEIEKLRNVIVTLQNNNRNCLEDEISKQALKEDVDENEVPECETVEDANGTNCEASNGNNCIRDIKNEETSSFGVLPDVSAPNEENKVETNNPNHRIAIRTASANSFSVDVSKINDENKTDVNGLVIDKLVHESQVFADNTEIFSRSKTKNQSDFCEIDGVYFRPDTCNFSAGTDTKPRKRRHNPYKTHKDNQSVPKISRNSKLRLSPRKHTKRRLRLNLRREYNSLENLTLSKMLHRSRPDLIKGIASHSKDGLPSTSSQSFTDVSGLSQSASENSLNSSGSVDSQTSENKSVKNWPEKSLSMEENKKSSNLVKSTEAMQKRTTRQPSIGDGSGSSTPTQGQKPLPRRKGDKRSEIVAAVTTRLYATKKKPDPRMEALQAPEKDDDDDGELEELKLCKRARMKLFDLSRKLAMAKRIKKTTDNDTQTDFASGTIRVKEKCVSTDQSGVVQQQNSSTNTPTDRPLKQDKEQPIIMNQVFIPRFGNYVVECGKNVRVEVPGSKSMKYDSETQTVTTYKDQTTSPPMQSPNDENFSDDSLEDDDSGKCKRNCEVDSLEVCERLKANKSGVKSQSNENVSKPSFTRPLEPISFHYRRSYDSLIDSGLERTDRSWLPITRYPIAGTNSLYEYDPNKSNPDLVYGNIGNEPKTNKDNKYLPKPVSPQEPPGNKIRKTEIVFPLYNGLPLAICTETVSSGENIAEDALNLITSSMGRFFQNEENESSENSFISNDGSDITSSSETSSEDFVFYEGRMEKEPLNRQSGLGNLYTISENSELSDLTASDPSSPHSSLQVLEQKKENKVLSPLGTVQGNQHESGRIHNENEVQNGLNKDYTVGVHILRNPLLSDLEAQERVIISGCDQKNGCKSHSELESSSTKCASSKNDRLNSRPALDPDIMTGKLINSSETEPEVSNSKGKPVTSLPEGSKMPQKCPGVPVSDAAAQKSDENTKHDKKVMEKVKKINWSEVQASTQRQFLNFNILGSSKQTPFSIDSNMFGEKKQTSEARFPSEDSITFVFMGPNRQKTSMLMEIIKRTLGQCSSSDQSFGEKSHRKSKNRAVQCKLMRSVSVDTAMTALSRFAKHQRPTIDIARTSSLDNLVPEEMQNILEQGRLHGIKEKGCQCNFNSLECQCHKSHVIKYTTCTSTTRDQGTETEKSLDMTDKCSMTSSLVDASCDALDHSDENLFDEYFPPLPRTTLDMNRCQNSESHWKDMKEVILGTSDYSTTAEERKPKSVGKSKKSVSWSDLSDYEEPGGQKSEENMRFPFEENECFPQFVTTEKLFCPSETSQKEEYINVDYTNPVDRPPVQDYSHTRRVRFTEPKRSCSEDMCNLLHEQNEAVQTATNVTAFLKEAVQLLKNLNNLSQIYDISTTDDKVRQQTDEGSSEEVRSSMKKVEISVQTETSIHGIKDVSLSAESSPIRRARTSSTSLEKRDRKGTNLTWPRPRPAGNRSNISGKPPTGLKSNSVLKPSRSPLPRTPSTHLSYDVIKNDIETSSTSTNWNISNLSTTFSNSYFGDSCSRPSSSKSFYSEKEGSNKYWSRPKILSPRLPKSTTDLEADLEDSCRRLEIAVERDKLREENSSLKLSSVNTKKYIPSQWCYTKNFENNIPGTKTENRGVPGFKSTAGISPVENDTFRKDKPLGRRASYSKRKPCKCYCHYRNNRVYRSSLELEAQPSFERHCHVCCTPCDAKEPEMSSSTPALNSICEDNKCRLLYYGYCPCSPVKLQHVKSSPRAYMQHLLSLRRQIVKNTYDQAKNT